MTEKKEKTHKFAFLKRLALATVDNLQYGHATTFANFKRYIVPSLKNGNPYGIRAHSLKRLTNSDWKIIMKIIRAVLDQKPISFRFSQDLHAIELRRKLFLSLTKEQYDFKETERTARASKPFGSLLPQDGDGINAEDVATR